MSEEIPREQLAQGDDEFLFTATYRDNSKQLVADKVALSWNEIFDCVGPSMYGFIQRKSKEWNKSPAYVFERNVVEAIRAKIVERCQNREIKIIESEIDTCIFQFKELGYVMFENKEEDDGETFRGYPHRIWRAISSSIEDHSRKVLILVRTGQEFHSIGRIQGNADVSGVCLNE